ncbi:MAG: glycosyltransferase [Thermoplasmatales archaeon]
MVYEVSIILCTINEINTLPKVVDCIESGTEPSYQIVFVDDGSSDGTREYIVDYSKRKENCKYVFNDSKRSLLIANIVGLKNSDGNFIIIMDADMQHPPEKVNDIYLKLKEGNDVVVGSRYTDGGSTGNRSPLRGLISRVAGFMARVFIKNSRKTTDPLSGFFGFRRGLSFEVDQRWRGYKTLLFLLASNPSVKVEDIPYRFEERMGGKSKIVSGLDFIFTYVIELILAKRVELTAMKKLKKIKVGDFWKE